MKGGGDERKGGGKVARGFWRERERERRRKEERKGERGTQGGKALRFESSTRAHVT
jgi:hypothetical protein